MPKRELSPESSEFTRPARRKLSLPPMRGLLALPSEVVVEVLHCIYPKHCLRGGVRQAHSLPHVRLGTPTASS